MSNIIKVKDSNGNWINIPALKGADGTMTFEDLTEEQKLSLKGDKGDTGDIGADGHTPYIGPNGNWFINGQDLNVSPTGIPIASATTLGGVKIGESLTIDESGVLNAQAINLMNGTATGSLKHINAYDDSDNGLLGEYAFAEGRRCAATGKYSHAEGSNSVAYGKASHVEGYYTLGHGVTGSHVQGEYNVKDDNGEMLHIVGNGSETKRSNAHTIDTSGNAWFAGDVYVGSTSGTNKDSGSKKLATKDDIDNAVAKATSNISNFPTYKFYSEATTNEAIENALCESGILTDMLNDYKNDKTPQLILVTPLVDSTKDIMPKVYQIISAENESLILKATDESVDLDFNSNMGTTTVARKIFQIIGTITDGAVSSCKWREVVYYQGHFLDAAYMGSTVFTPTNDNHPANKKYVDDAIAAQLTSVDTQLAEI